jgi:5-methylcytosine-specific restriction endonuclease McrA
VWGKVGLGMGRAEWGMAWIMNKKQFKNLISKSGWWEAYRQYLASPSWQKKRKERLKIDGYQCKTCGEDGTNYQLEIHHKPSAYNDIPNEDIINDLVTLCSICHEAITNSIRQRRYDNRDIKSNFYTGRRPERKTQDYGVENSEIQTSFRSPNNSAQWRNGKPDGGIRQTIKAVFVKKRENGSRL